MGKKKTRQYKEMTPEEKAQREAAIKPRRDERIRENIVRLSLMKKEATALGFTELASKYEAQIAQLNAALG
jgi:hypothetical protein